MSSLDTLLQKLRQEREELTRQITNIERSDAEESLSDQAGESSHYSDHPADAATITFEREMDQAILRDLHSLLRRIERAIEKVESGSYGTCDRCGGSISSERLQALPSACLCLSCQDLEDSI